MPPPVRTRGVRIGGRERGIAAAIVAAFLSAATPSWAQGPASGSNTGALTFSGGLDVPTIYFFRGIRQEGDPKITFWPHGDLRIQLGSGVAVSVGVWNSLHTGTSGTGGSTRKLHYQENFYSTFSLGFGRGLTVGTTFMAYTSPNNSFSTVKEFDFKVSNADTLAPYALIAFEIGGTRAGQADEGAKKGTYAEFGAGPNWRLPFGSARLTVPVKVGLSVKDYYELFGSDLKYRDNKFGFFDVGGLVTVPLGGASRFGSWNIHGGADLLLLGDTTKAFNKGEKRRIVGLVGVGLTY